MKFKDFLNEAKIYNKKGKMYVLKQPIDLGSAIELLAIGRDTNGNRLVRLYVSGQKKSIQLDGSTTVSIDDVEQGLTDRQIEHIKNSI